MFVTPDYTIDNNKNLKVVVNQSGMNNNNIYSNNENLKVGPGPKSDQKSQR